MIPVNVLSVQFLPNADPALRQALDLPTDAPALALISTDCDDATLQADCSPVSRPPPKLVSLGGANKVARRTSAAFSAASSPTMASTGGAMR